MAFFTRRFENLQVEVQILESRIDSGAASPEEARKSIKTLTEAVASANAVGDLASLAARITALEPKVEAAAEAKREAKRAAGAQALERKQQMVAEAEQLAEGNNWRTGVEKFRALLDEWKALPRIDKATDDDLWHRFSSARTTYTRRRKAQFAQQAEVREVARKAKEAIIVEAEALSTSTEWGPTSAAFRELMSRWKAAGSAPRAIDEQLWTRFRALQDTFFEARNQATSEADAERNQNLAAKEALLVAAEAEIIPVTDPAAAKEAFRKFLTQFNEIGHVPRNSMRQVDGRVRALEAAVREAEEAEWKRTDPEAKQRAIDTIAMFEAQIAKLNKQLEAATQKGDKRRIKDATDSITTYESWLAQAKETLADFNR